MAVRAAVLYDEKDRPLGKVMVPESTFVIEHAETFFFRTPEGVRLRGGGIGVKFLEIEPLVRNKLEPI